MAPKPRWLTDSTMLAIHAQQVERFGGAHGAVANNKAGDHEVAAYLRGRSP